MCGIAGTIFRRKKTFTNKVTTDDLNKIIHAVNKNELSVDCLLKACWDYKSNINFLRFINNRNERINIEKISNAILNISKTYLDKISNIDKISNVKKFNKIFKDYESLQDSYWFLNNELLSLVESIKYFDNGENFFDDQNIIFYKKLTTIINAIDNRLEFRGRDSLGISIQLLLNTNDFSSKNYTSKDNAEQFFCEKINNSTIFTFIFKTANEVGSLGDNAKVLKQLIKNNQTLNDIISNGLWDSGSIVIHTRWASVGEVNIPNCHPISNVIDNKQILDPLVLASMNGDVYNYKDILSSLNKQDYILSKNKCTNDCIVFPLALAECDSFGIESIINKINTFSGSYTVALQSSERPSSVILCSNGKQGLYIGIAEDEIMFASDVYGLIESCKYFYPLKPGSILDLSYDSFKNSSNSFLNYIDINSKEDFKISKQDLLTTNITTRDIHKGNYDHFLEKEIRETKDIVSRTILNYLQTNCPKNINNIIAINEKQVPLKIINNFKNNKINKIIITGMGTCYTAAAAIAMYMRHILRKYFNNIQIEPHIATEASAFYLKQHMDDTLVIAVAQSGTTIDTNVFVQKAKERGASSLAIANKREGDVTFLVDGTLYIGTGRDIEIAVPSTKTYTAQIILGYILTTYISSHLDHLNKNDIINISNEAEKIKKVPSVIDNTFNYIDKIQDLKQHMKICCYYKSWYITHDDSPNSVCAMEARIKFSEGCYHSLPYMHVDNLIKYKITNSFILYITNKCNETILSDLNTLNERNNYVILITNSTDSGILNNFTYDNLIRIISIPNTDPYYSFIPAIIVCQLLSYYAALALDNRKKYFLKLYENVTNEKLLKSNWHLLVDSVNNGLFNEGFSNAHFLELKQAIHEYKHNLSKNNNRRLLLSNIINNLHLYAKRPIDTIKHQAKTITVGTVRDTTHFMLQDNAYDCAVESDLDVNNISYRKFNDLIMDYDLTLDFSDKYTDYMIYLEDYESFYGNYILDFLNTINYKYNLDINIRLTKYYDLNQIHNNSKHFWIFVYKNPTSNLSKLIKSLNNEDKLEFNYARDKEYKMLNNHGKEYFTKDMYMILKTCCALFAHFTKEYNNTINYISNNFNNLYNAIDIINNSQRFTIDVRNAAKIFASRTYWKCAGSGTNYNIARFTAMKLIDKFNRSCAFDVLENHKHIDISAESAILIFIANIWSKGYQSDIKAEIDKLISHNNTPIIITNEGDTRFDDMRIIIKYTANVNEERPIPLIKIPIVEELLAFPLNELVADMFIKELNKLTILDKDSTYDKTAFDNTISPI